MPSNPNYTARLIKRTSRVTTLTREATTNENTYFNLVENGTIRDSYQFKGDTIISVTSTAGSNSAAGIVTISATAFSGATAENGGIAGYLSAPTAGS